MEPGRRLWQPFNDLLYIVDKIWQNILHQDNRWRGYGIDQTLLKNTGALTLNLEYKWGLFLKSFLWLSDEGPQEKWCSFNLICL